MLMRSTTTFFHGTTMVVVGEVYDSEHPLVRRFGAAMFEPAAGVDGPPVVESATAAPGEKRATVARNRKPRAGRVADPDSD